jgi:hypothetical protein
MSRNASISLAWADGEYDFRLGLGQIEELQEACDAGPYVILQHLIAGTWRVKMIRETLRLGLIGGGMQPTQAIKLIQRYHDELPWAHNVKQATAVMHAAVLGAPDGEKPGKAKAARAKGAASSQTESSLSPPTTARAQP